ncbi:hypothetical protein LSH36_199g02019 [Paralvinella palmiformis]|uniref:Uncharacterized protein n=1 Tax=Paralvinella palmiformis TaxID=53620 RepID=A0AAD9JPN2_9ANNE|nr:hypothetical protein LSH36_199g02019 [Paralvinella palmiformis]
MNESLEIEQRLESLSKLDPAIKVELHKSKIQVDQLKNAFHNEYVRYSMLHALDAASKNGDTLEATISSSLTGDTPMEEEMSNIQKEVNKMKKDIDQSKSCIEDTSKELEKAYEDYEAGLKVLNELTEEYQLKQNTLSTTNLNDDSENTLDSVQKMKAAINTLSRDTEKQLRATELSILTMNSVLLEDKEQNNRMKIDMTHCSEQKRILEWCHKVLDFIEVLPGIKDRGVIGDRWCVSIAGVESESSNLKLNVTMTLGWCYDKPVLRSVQVDNTDLDLNSVINRAIELNDIRYLLANLQNVWLSRYMFVSELETLRQSYALDWDQSTHTLKVIFGKRADLVCILNVRPDYPSSGTITLESVKGDSHIDLESIKLVTQNSTLTDWLNHLHKKLGKI